ncbi:MAG: 50S ribosomal protein L28 [Chloroflexi bacterium]|nr:50S ribosomal protein L28 [Chloroflexota bacterium]
MAKCSICDKRKQTGFNVSHSKRHTRRKWEPNVQKATIIRDGQPQKVNICTRCLRTEYKNARA